MHNANTLTEGCSGNLDGVRERFLRVVATPFPKKTMVEVFEDEPSKRDLIILLLFELEMRLRFCQEGGDSCGAR
jgi:hypothetical protein